MGTFFKLLVTPCLCFKLYFSEHQLMHYEPSQTRFPVRHEVLVGLLLSSFEKGVTAETSASAADAVAANFMRALM